MEAPLLLGIFIGAGLMVISFALLLNRSGYSPKHIENSFLEWLDNKTGMSREFMESLTVTEVVIGNVVSAERRNGKIGGLKYYYTGEKGNYVYDSVLVLKKNGKTIPLYFSALRTKVLRVYRGSELIELEDLKDGESVMVSETVEVRKSNLNDQNLVNLTIKVR